jgi:hypothetical protein
MNWKNFEEYVTLVAKLGDKVAQKCMTVSRIISVQRVAFCQLPFFQSLFLLKISNSMCSIVQTPYSALPLSNCRGFYHETMGNAALISRTSGRIIKIKFGKRKKIENYETIKNS